MLSPLDRRPLGNALVAMDFSQDAERALDRACRLPVTPGSTITLLHVVPRLEAPLEAHAERAARARLEELAERTRARVARTTNVAVAVAIGEPAAEIARRAESDRTELVVLGRHGHRRLRDALGTTVDRVVRQEGTSGVLVVARPAVAPYRRPLVAVDEEGSASAAIALMARLVAPEVRGALALHALDGGRYGVLAQYELPQADIDAFRSAREARSRGTIERALDDLGGTELDFDLRCVDADPRLAVLEAAQAEHADLVVVGTHARGGLRWLVLGSVAEAILRNAPLDVLVARAVAA